MAEPRRRHATANMHHLFGSLVPCTNRKATNSRDSSAEPKIKYHFVTPTSFDQVSFVTSNFQALTKALDLISVPLLPLPAIEQVTSTLLILIFSLRKKTMVQTQ